MMQSGKKSSQSQAKGSIRHLLFDVDGTLIDSKRDIAEAQLWVLQQLGVHRHSVDDIYPHIGRPLTEIFVDLR